MTHDWGARLTPGGYHAMPIKKPDVGTRWNGPTNTANDGWVDGKSIVATDPTNGNLQLEVRVGDDAASAQRRLDAICNILPYVSTRAKGRGRQGTG